MTAVPAAGLDSARIRRGNPFPGLRPFEQHEAPLFFGRDEQCDDLLGRLARHRLVAVVGMSGSGKSSLVRAGLLPALDRGYLPAAGSSWHVAIFRPGADPVGNLSRGLLDRRLPEGAPAAHDGEELGQLLRSSSLGLVHATRGLLDGRPESLLVVADQFEEIFRFSRIARAGDALEQAASCVDLLVNATRQDEVPVYVVLTMRSDYLGDCAQFTGLPEALNDSQFLVPRMTRAQLRDAIECPIAVGGARINPALVQQLLYDIDELGSRTGDSSGVQHKNQDQLPVLQHALMRVWDVSRADRERGDWIDFPHYERPPVETLKHALDRHAEEVYRTLPTDRHRDIARLVFQQLTDRDPENREVRRPTPLGELAAVALRSSGAVMTESDAALVNDVIAAFSAEGRAFINVNAQQDVDISHESFIRNWTRLRQWVEQENRSRRVYTKLADVASSWADGSASLYRGPELAEARRWWDQEKPTQIWANRYDSRFDVARKFLEKSVRSRLLRRGLIFGNVAILVLGAITIAVLMGLSRQEARRAEASALEARNAVQAANSKFEEANKLISEALQAQKQGKSSRADELAQQAQAVQKEASVAQVLTPSELTELDSLRRERAERERTERDLRQQLAAARTAPPVQAVPARPEPEPVATSESVRKDAADLERLRNAESTWERETVQLRQQLAASNERAAALKRSNDELQVRVADTAATAVGNPDITAIEALLNEYQTAYERLDAAAVSRVMPSVPTAELVRSFSQLRSYEMEIAGSKINVTGDTSTVTAIRRMVVQPKVGSRPAPRVVPSVFHLRRAANGWIIESIEERR
jgi:conflict system STAND superfamily ATPase